MEKLKALVRLEESLAKLPSVGRRSAERMAYAMLNMEEDDLAEFSNAILDLKKSIRVCPICGFLTENKVCEICSDKERDNNTLMVVSYPKDVIAFENAESYHGLYHVLNGSISLNGSGSIDNIDTAALLDRISENNIQEVIIATNPTIEGEATGLFIAKILEHHVPKITRLAYGLQMGGNLDYTDSLTLAKAVEGRTKI